MINKTNKQSQPFKLEPTSVVYIATFPPRACGIATFSEDLTNAIDKLFSPATQSKIIAMNANETDAFRYPEKVIFQISQKSKPDYLAAAKLVNEDKEIKLVSIQHEFGIFGGRYGAYIILFLMALKKPSVVSFHTVLPTPDPMLMKIVQKIATHVSNIIVMTNLAKSILVSDYNISAGIIVVIPHGIHHRPYVLNSEAKKKYHFPDRTILSTFGFLSRGKGIEYVIDALPKVAEKFPNVLYLVCGMTHPNILKKEGETYRNSLVRKAHQLGVQKHLKFYNAYLSLDDVFKFLELSDIYVSTSLNPNQAVSGTLSYALGTGRPVVSTAFSQAKELITPDVGLLVPMQDSEAFANAIIKILDNEKDRQNFGLNAYYQTRFMIWPNVAIQYIKTFSKFSYSIKKSKQHKRLPKIKLDHLENMTDDFGLFQFAKLSAPLLDSGYTLDDNARALIAVILFYERYKLNLNDPNKMLFKKRLQRLMSTYLNVLFFLSKEDGTFNNYINFDKSLHKEANSRDSLEDSNGRALHALAITTANPETPKFIKEKALQLLKRSISKHPSFLSPRAISFYIKALYYLIKARLLTDEFDLVLILQNQAKILVEHFDTNADQDWHWFEHYLTYANAILPEALLFAYQITKEPRYLDIAQKAARFLIDVHFIDGVYVPIGQDGWYHKEGKRNHFDQQPEDTSSMVQLLCEMYKFTQDFDYKELMNNAFGWFLGNNALEQVVYDEFSGGCCDGIHKEGINLNQGAESTISYLIARLQFQSFPSEKP